MTQRKWPGESEDEHPASLAMSEALFFAEGTAVRLVAEAFLRAHADHLAHRALRLVDAVAQQDTQGWLDVEITCVDCGTHNLEL